MWNETRKKNKGGINEDKRFSMDKKTMRNLNGTPSPTRTDMNRSSTDFESVAFGLEPLTVLTF